MECQQSHGTNITMDANSTSSQAFCPGFSDNVSCWPQTPAGSLAVVPCPTHFEDLLLFPGNVTRLCLENGTWHIKSDYSQCLDLPMLESQQTNNFHSYVQRIMYYVGFSISVVALSVALFLFLFFRSLRCLRNIIHCHLIVTFILKYLLWLKMVPTMPALILQNNSSVHQWICKLIVSLFNYLLVTNFFWMLIEGLYLHTVLVWAFAHDRLRFWYYALLGWGVPAVFIISWAIVKAMNDNNTCWLLGDSQFDYIYVVPIFIVLVINLVFLASIVWILVTKLRASKSSQNCLYKKAAKATLILFPLLGPTYLLFFYMPQKSHVFLAYVNVFLQSTQGFFVATFYCFLNVEVQSTVKKYLSRWQDGRKLSWRTQTSVIVQAEQASLHGAYKEDLMSKARAAIRQMGNLERQKELPPRTERGFSNGVHRDQPDVGVDPTREVTGEPEASRQNGNGSREVACRLQEFPTRGRDFEQESDVDIIKEDLV